LPNYYFEKNKNKIINLPKELVFANNALHLEYFHVAQKHLLRCIYPINLQLNVMNVMFTLRLKPYNHSTKTLNNSFNILQKKNGPSFQTLKAIESSSILYVLYGWKDLWCLYIEKCMEKI